MLNSKSKEEAIEDLKRANAEYVAVYKKVVGDIENLHNIRKTTVQTLRNIDSYIEKLANRPRDFEMKMGKISKQYHHFENRIKELERMAEENVDDTKAGAKGMSGALFGAGVGAFGPTAAMAVAMTFGTASTGTAIASLSGAAATNAALAWLGGGTVAAGAAGVAGGQALLTLAGPVGWAIGIGSLLASAGVINKSNKEVAEEAEKSTKAIKKEENRIKKVDVSVMQLKKETVEFSNKLSKQLYCVRRVKKEDYNLFTDEEINELIALLNSAEVLSKKIGATITESGEIKYE